MKRFIMLIIILLALVPGPSLYACTAFCISKGDTVLVGNNEDYNNPNTKVWYVPAEKGKYGRVYFGFDNFFPQGGMNEKGLVFDGFASEPYRVKYSLDKPIFSGNLMDKVVSECATVDEALEMFDKYSMAFLTQGMLFIADEHGNSAIIERDNVIRKKGKYQVVTNFYQSKTKKEDINCGRYKIATAMLENAVDISVDLGKRVLAATHNEGAYPTLYSNVYDLKRKIVYLYHFHNFQNEAVIDLKAELARGARRIDLPDLFPKTFVAENFKNSSKADSSKQKAPVPNNVSYVKPAGDVPKNIQNLLGMWEGAWGGQLNSYMIFEKVTIDSARVIYGWGTEPSSGITQGGYSRVTASLTYKGDDTGIDFEFGIIKGTLSADGKTIDAVYNGQSLISMKKVEYPFTDRGNPMDLTLKKGEYTPPVYNPELPNETKGLLSGTWKGTVPGPDGTPLDITYEFESVGKDLTGTVSTILGGGPFSGGKVEGNKLSFYVNIGDRTVYTNGTISGDVINMTRNNGDEVQQYTVKRVTERTVAVDITGTWAGTAPGPDGNPMDITYEFESAGDVLTGTVSTKLGGGPFSGGKIEGNIISIYVETAEFNIYTNGAVSGDTISMTQKIRDEVKQFTVRRVTKRN
jgi:hypothetical protein